MNARMILLYLAGAWYLNTLTAMAPEDVQLELLRRRITIYRTVAEAFGRKVIELESKHTVLAAGNRMS